MTLTTKTTEFSVILYADAQNVKKQWRKNRFTWKTIVKTDLACKHVTALPNSSASLSTNKVALL